MGRAGIYTLVAWQPCTPAICRCGALARSTAAATQCLPGGFHHGSLVYMLALLPGAGRAAACPREVSPGDHSQPRVAMVTCSRCHHQPTSKHGCPAAGRAPAVQDHRGRARDLQAQVVVMVLVVLGPPDSPVDVALPDWPFT